MPRSIPGLTLLHDASDATKSLWHRLPRLVPISAPDEREVHLAVHSSLKTLSFHAYNGGLAVHGAGLGQHTAAERKAMGETAILASYQATACKSAKPTPYSDDNPLCCVLNVWTKTLSPPENIVAQYHLCGDTTQLGINITPKGSFIDLHYDIGRSGFSMVYGPCKKVFILAPLQNQP